MKMSGIEGISRSVAVEDVLQPHQQQQFTDTECRIENDKVSISWGEIYKSIKEQAYTKLYAKEEMKDCDRKIWDNIWRSRINQVATIPRFFPCGEFIRVMVKQADLENRWILDHKGQPIASFQPSNLETTYKFLEVEQYMDDNWWEVASRTNKLALIKE